jgi:hypothetical protein
MVKVGSIVAALTAVVVGATCGAAGASHDPVPGAANCHGQLVAIANHSSGEYGASGNSNSSAGPGQFLHSDTHAAITEYVVEVCTN